MDNREIRKKLDTIFEKESRSPKRDYRAKYAGSKELLPCAAEGAQVTATMPLIEDNPKRFELYFPNLYLLIKLHSSISNINTDVKVFFDYLKHYFSHPHLIPKQASYLAFETLIELKSFEEAFSSWLTETKKEKVFFSDEYKNILDIVSSKLQYEYHRFKETDLDSMSEAIYTILTSQKGEPGTIIWGKCHGILEQINEIRYIRLKGELEAGVNPEINADKDKVIEKINLFGFSVELGGALNKIDEYYWNTTSDKFDWAMANGLLREFLTRLLREISGKIHGKTGDEITRGKDESEFTSFKSYIKKHLPLGGNENKLIKALYGLTSSEGAHTIITEREYFRLCKNMIIELSLLLMSKLERFLEDN